MPEESNAITIDLTNDKEFKSYLEMSQKVRQILFERSDELLRDYELLLKEAQNLISNTIEVQ